jgi:hypothetical protein
MIATKLDFETLHAKAFIEPEGYEEILDILQGDEILTNKELQDIIYDIHLSETCFALSVGWSDELLVTLSEKFRRAGLWLERHKKKCPKDLARRLDVLHDLVYLALRQRNEDALVDESFMLFGGFLRKLSLQPIPIEEFQELTGMPDGNFARVLRRCEVLGWIQRTSSQRQQFVALTRDAAARLHLFRYAIDKREARKLEKT